MLPILTLEDQHKSPHPSLDDDPAMWLPVWKASSYGQSFVPPSGVAKSPTVAARVNHGRWLVDCPREECGEAQLVSPRDKRFVCTNCGNVLWGEKWLRVVWPRNRDAIEAELVRRPSDVRNWFPGETVAQLRAENISGGVAEPLATGESLGQPTAERHQRLTKPDRSAD